MMLNFQLKTNTRSIVRWGLGGDFDIEVLDERSGILILRVKGRDAKKCFRYEAGGHRWQRVPPTEKRGRRQTSTITVAVLPEAKRAEIQISEKDLEWKFSRGTGPGGQHKNKTDTAVQLKHKPTGLIVRIDSRSQSSNKDLALDTLRAKLLDRKKQTSYQQREQMRKGQVGMGMRGDKIRTICERDGIVYDDRTGKKMPYKRYVKGDFDELME